MSTQEQQSVPPPRWRVFLWLVGVYAAVAVGVVVVTFIPYVIFNRQVQRSQQNQRETATARAQQGGFNFPAGNGPAGDGSSPPSGSQEQPNAPIQPDVVMPIILPGAAATPIPPPLPASTSEPEAVPAGDGSVPSTTLNDGDAAVVAPPTALPTFPPGSNPDMFANGATYTVAAQTPQSTLRVVSAQQTSASMVLTVEYLATDSRKVGVSQPGDKDAFYIQSGGNRYPLLSAANIAVGSTSQQVPVGTSLTFTLTFAPLHDPAQPFDLIEGEHTASASASYWDIDGILLKPG